jgi:hypothetical protein
MKKHIITACTLLVLTSSCVHAQVIRTSQVTHGKHVKDTASTASLPKNSSPSKSYLNEFNTNATRDFMKRFKDPTDVQWTKEAKGFIVAFNVNGIKTRTAYNSSGDWVYTIKYYDEWKLPKDVRAQVKSTYYDYTITQVEEIVQQIQSEPTYLVHLQDSKTWKNVLVCNGEMVVMEEFDKE